MKRDNEQFKAKNRDESYIKDKRPDVQLGRHTDISQSKPITQAKKNRMYQSRQEYKETITVTAETPDKADLGMDFTEQKYLPENPQEQASNDVRSEQVQAEQQTEYSEDFAFADDGNPAERPTATQKNRRFLIRAKGAW